MLAMAQQIAFRAAPPVVGGALGYTIATGLARRFGVGAVFGRPGAMGLLARGVAVAAVAWASTYVGRWLGASKGEQMAIAGLSAAGAGLTAYAPELGALRGWVSRGLLGAGRPAGAAQSAADPRYARRPTGFVQAV